ncbi:YccF domain-containing protein [Haemophilus parahaemolyticus]|uniref:YccF domain-containing protein n=1 Tax=Haemophilus parahaemolyticus TaxID=735 RepID=UPI0028E5B707|nr:YccF domain-containing protein [Haemophilus parahaemolyticus]
MRTLGNVLWFFCGGVLLALANFILGLILVALVITAPIGFGLLQYSKFCLFPFTTSMVSKSKHDVKQNPIWKTYSSIIMVVYVILIGWWNFLLALCSIVVAVPFIVTIPPAIAMAKSLGTIFNPVGKICVPIAVAKELEQRVAVKKADKLMG